MAYSKTTLKSSVQSKNYIKVDFIFNAVFFLNWLVAAIHSL